MPRKKRVLASYGIKLLALFCVIFTVAGMLVGCGSQAKNHATEDKTLPAIVVGCDDYTPFSYVDADGKMTGIDVELAEEAFWRMGYRAECTIINWEEKKPCWRMARLIVFGAASLWTAGRKTTGGQALT